LKACPEREASCCFRGIGCQVVPAHKDLDKHLEDSTQGHLMLLMKTMIEQQDMAQALASRVAELEATCAQMNSAREAELRAAAALSALVVGLEAKMIMVEKKAAQDVKAASDKAAEELKKRTEVVEKEAKKRIEAIEKSHKTETGSLRSELSKHGSAHAKTADLSSLRSDFQSLKSSLETRERIESRMSSSDSVSAPPDGL